MMVRRFARSELERKLPLRYDGCNAPRDPRLCWVVEKEGHLGRRNRRIIQGEARGQVWDTKSKRARVYEG